MRRIALVAIGLSLISALPAVAQQAVEDKLKVAVSATTEDGIGKQFAYALREEFRKSARYALIEDERLATYTVGLVTIDPMDDRNQTMTVAAVTLTSINPAPLFLNEKAVPLRQSPIFNLPLLVSSWVRTVGRNRVADSARSMVASVDQEVIKLHDLLSRSAPK